MSRLDKKRAGISPGSKKVLTAKMFLGKDGSKPYLSSEDLLSFIDNRRIEDVEGLEYFFELVKQCHRIVVPSKAKYDKGKNAYKYATFQFPNGTDGAKVALIENINQFMLDYRDGMFTIDFTLEDLVSEAETSIEM